MSALWCRVASGAEFSSSAATGSSATRTCTDWNLCSFILPNYTRGSASQTTRSPFILNCTSSTPMYSPLWKIRQSGLSLKNFSTARSSSEWSFTLSETLSSSTRIAASHERRKTGRGGMSSLRRRRHLRGLWCNRQSASVALTLIDVCTIAYRGICRAHELQSFRKRLVLVGGDARVALARHSL